MIGHPLLIIISVGQYLHFRHTAALRFCLTAESLARGGTRQGDALFPRASSLQKQSTGLFLNSPPARGIVSGVFRRLRTATRGSSRLPARSALLSLRLRGVHRTPAPSGLCKPLKRLDLNFPFCSP